MQIAATLAFSRKSTFLSMHNGVPHALITPLNAIQPHHFTGLTAGAAGAAR
jgi:hypothetical protein